MKIRISITTFLFMLMAFISCKKEIYSFGSLQAPSGLGLNAVVSGADSNNPNGSGSGEVTISITAANAIKYKIDFGDGTSQIVPTGNIVYKYSTPGTNVYTITVNAIGTGGSISTITKEVTVFTAFTIPTDIVQDLTNGSSQVWITDAGAVGHVGVGPAGTFSPDYYAATPNSRAACQYDDEITFSKDANGNISMTINNMGQSFLIAASTSFYGQSGGDGCYDVTLSGAKQLTFMNATSGSTSAVSTGIQFMVPGNGLVNFGTGGNTYEILAITPTTLYLRNIGIDGNAWYQKLKVK
ncbi:PKD domain-containing protein [Mucilaginibacter gotjawali]|uniref:Uncharacterized protein n=2 Tax=Mucilaginibacter gotjawali TaxID=1550579 RepID=A0A839SMT9_9SPHI|nr:PKD domain-containing protein [Mucilaginibacter gotjawali]MBB3057727.1 hypothetical protein [Mucilaginibacter gotjawali]BAU52530.1 hypothetical protein MgSA37_00692 [Mucilaginibacter gotjawali]